METQMMNDKRIAHTAHYSLAALDSVKFTNKKEPVQTDASLAFNNMTLMLDS